MTVFILSCDGKYALQKRPDTGLLASMWQFPNCEGKLELQQALELVQQWGLTPKDILRQTERSHIFTHIRWEIICIWVRTESAPFDTYTLAEIEEEISLPTAFKQCLGIVQ